MYVFSLYKNSTYRRPLLEASPIGRSIASVPKLLVKDFASSVVLLLRLSIYNAVDDVFDSNYSFTCDFEEGLFLRIL